MVVRSPITKSQMLNEWPRLLATNHQAIAIFAMASLDFIRTRCSAGQSTSLSEATSH